MESFNDNYYEETFSQLSIGAQSIDDQLNVSWDDIDDNNDRSYEEVFSPLFETGKAIDDLAQITSQFSFSPRQSMVTSDFGSEEGSIACDSIFSESNSRTQMNKSPENINLKSSADGRTPVHWLLLHNAPIDAIKSAVTEFPESLQMRDCNFQTPLDVAIQNGADEEIIDYICSVLHNFINYEKDRSKSLRKSSPMRLKKKDTEFDQVRVNLLFCGETLKDTQASQKPLNTSLSEIKRNSLRDKKKENCQSDDEPVVLHPGEGVRIVDSIQKYQPDNITRDIQACQSGIQSNRSQFFELKKEVDDLKTEWRPNRDDINRVRSDDAQFSQRNNSTTEGNKSHLLHKTMRTLSRLVCDKKTLERQLSYLARERLILLKFRNQPNFQVGHLQDQIEILQSEQIQMVHQLEKISDLLMRARKDNANEGMVQTKQSPAILFENCNFLQRHENLLKSDGETTPVAILEKEINDETSPSIIVEESHLNLKKNVIQHCKETLNCSMRAHTTDVIDMFTDETSIHIRRIQKEKDDMFRQLSHLKAERLVLLQYRHGSELERRDLFETLGKLEKEQVIMKKVLHEIGQRENRRRERKRTKRRLLIKEKTEHLHRQNHITMKRNLGQSKLEGIDCQERDYDANHGYCIPASLNKWLSSKKSYKAARKDLGPLSRCNNDLISTHTSVTTELDMSSISENSVKCEKRSFRKTNRVGFRSNIFHSASDLNFQAIADAMRLKLATKEITRDHCVARKCFVASEAVSFLVSNDFARTRPQAVLIGKALGIIYNLFEHIGETQREFEDEHLFFRFIDDGEYSISGCFQPNSLLNLDAIGIDLRLGLKVRDRRTKILRKIKNCFTGSEFVDFLVTNKMVHSREDSVRIGRAHKSICKIFEPVGSNKENISCFRDDPSCFYKFCQPNKMGVRSGIFSLHDGFRIGVTWSNAV
mmetsp:Transcript_59597/g.69635  ORF Transcript_59597/g.69635 Transcript_59597/m.69635 type:complete len:933 (-) Transcript_59597:50-2848(-)